MKGMRKGLVERETTETQIRVAVNLDGSGRHKVSTGVAFLDHMLQLLARHALIDLEIRAQGDLEVDDHHTVEDVGLVLGEALDQALGDRAGIVRYGWAVIPMDESQSQVAVDLGGRPFLVYQIANRKRRTGTIDLRLLEEFFRAFVTKARLNLHVEHRFGDEAHHAYESVFKALARALRMAVAIDPRESGVPSSKGAI